MEIRKLDFNKMQNIEGGGGPFPPDPGLPILGKTVTMLYEEAFLSSPALAGFVVFQTIGIVVMVIVVIIIS